MGKGGGGGGSGVGGERVKGGSVQRFNPSPFI